MEFHHTSVLLHETIGQLQVKPDGIYVDGTLGGGGHAYEVLRRLSPRGRLIGIDQDADAIQAAKQRLSEFENRVSIVRSNYANMRARLAEQGICKVDGIVLDLGVSSFQLDTPKRGFTYRDEHAPLDMRMDDRQELTAKDIVNEYSEKELFRIIRDFGEDKFAKNIAKHIVSTRKEKEILTTGELCAVIRAAIPMKVQKSGGHPAKRTFQAIRIELNRELEVLKDSLDDMIDLLNDGGRICPHAVGACIPHMLFKNMFQGLCVHTDSVVLHLKNHAVSFPVSQNLYQSFSFFIFNPVIDGVFNQRLQD